MDKNDSNVSVDDTTMDDSLLNVKTKAKKRSLVERELETNLTARVTSPARSENADSTSRYGRARQRKSNSSCTNTDMDAKNSRSLHSDRSLSKSQSPAYKINATKSPVTKTDHETPNKSYSTPNFVDKIESIYIENNSLSRFGSSEKKKSGTKFPKVYVRKDLIQNREKEETITLIKNMFSPVKSQRSSNSHLSNVLERSSEKYNMNSKHNGYLNMSSVVKALDFDNKKKKEAKETKTIISKSELFEMEAKCEYQVGDLAWARMGTYPFWPCIITRDPFTSIFVKKKMLGRGEREMTHVTFFGDNGRTSWIFSNMLRKFLGQLEFETTKEHFSPDAKKKDPKLYAAFFVSEKKMSQWLIAVEEAETLLREPKRLRIDIFYDMLVKSRNVKATLKQHKRGKITRTASDVSLSESLFDTLFSDEDGKVEDTDGARCRNRKSLDVSDVVTACLDSMAAKTGFTKIRKQSHMDRWLQKAKSKTPEKSQLKTQVSSKEIVKEKKEKVLSSKKINKQLSKNNPMKKKPYSLRKSDTLALSQQNEFNLNSNSKSGEVTDIGRNSLIPGYGIGIISKVESLSEKENSTEVHVEMPLCESPTFTQDFDEYNISMLENQDTDKILAGTKVINENGEPTFANSTLQEDTIEEENAKITSKQAVKLCHSFEINDLLSNSNMDSTKDSQIKANCTANDTQSNDNDKNISIDESVNKSIDSCSANVSYSEDINVNLTTESIGSQDSESSFVCSSPAMVNKNTCERTWRKSASSKNNKVRKKRSLRLKNRIKHNELKDDSFVKYMELHQDLIVDEHPELSQNEVVEYLLKTWQYERNEKVGDTNSSKTDENTGIKSGATNENIINSNKSSDESYIENKIESMLLHNNKDEVLVPESSRNYNGPIDDVIKTNEDLVTAENTVGISATKHFETNEQVSKIKMDKSSLMNLYPSTLHNNTNDKVTRSVKKSKKLIAESTDEKVVSVLDKSTSLDNTKDEISLAKKQTIMNSTQDNINKDSIPLNNSYEIISTNVDDANKKKNPVIENEECVIDVTDKDIMNAKVTNKSKNTTKCHKNVLEPDKSDNTLTSAIKETSHEKSNRNERDFIANNVLLENNSNSMVADVTCIIKETKDISESCDVVMSNASLTNNTETATGFDIASTINEKNDNDDSNGVDLNFILLENSTVKVICAGNGIIEKANSEMKVTNKKKVVNTNILNYNCTVDQIPVDINGKNKIKTDHIVKVNKELHCDNSDASDIPRTLEKNMDCSQGISKLVSTEPSDVSNNSKNDNENKTDNIINKNIILENGIEHVTQCSNVINKKTNKNICKKFKKSQSKKRLKSAPYVDNRTCAVPINDILHENDLKNVNISNKIVVDGEAMYIKTQDIEKNTDAYNVENNKMLIKEINEQSAKISEENSACRSLLETRNSNIKTVNKKKVCSVKVSDILLETNNQWPFKILDPKNVLNNTNVTLSSNSESHNDRPNCLNINVPPKCYDKLDSELSISTIVDMTAQAQLIEKEKVSNDINSSVDADIDIAFKTNKQEGNDYITENCNDVLAKPTIPIEEKVPCPVLLNGDEAGVYERDKNDLLVNKENINIENENLETMDPLLSNKIKLSENLGNENQNEIVIHHDENKEQQDINSILKSIDELVNDNQPETREVNAMMIKNNNDDYNKNIPLTTSENNKKYCSEYKHMNGDVHTSDVELSQNLAVSSSLSEEVTANLKDRINTNKEKKNLPDDVTLSYNLPEPVKINEFHSNSDVVSECSDGEFNVETSSIKSEDSEPLSYLRKKLITKQNQKKGFIYNDPEFISYMEMRQDSLMDEHPELSQEELVEYMFKTWQYEENLKSELIKSDDIQQLSVVKGMNDDLRQKSIRNSFRRNKIRKNKQIDEDSISLCSDISDVSEGRRSRRSTPVFDDPHSSKEGSPDKKSQVLDESINSSKTSERVTRRMLRKNTTNETDSVDIKLPLQPLELHSQDGKVNTNTDIKDETISTEQNDNKIISLDIATNSEVELIINDDPETASIISIDSDVSLSRYKQKVDKQITKSNPEFVKYLELRQDSLIDENPQLTEDEITSYLFKTWMYEESVKSDMKKSEDIEQANMVKGLNTEVQQPKKLKKTIKTEKIVEDEDLIKSKSKRKNSEHYYYEDLSDDEIELFDIFKPKHKIHKLKTVDDVKPLINQTQNAVKAIVKKEEMDVEEIVEVENDVELYFSQLTQLKPNVFKGLVREKVCEICEKTSNLVKCKGCNYMYHVDCVRKQGAVVEALTPSRGRKKKKRKINRKPKSLDESGSHSDEKCHDVSDENNGNSGEIIELDSITVDAETFEAVLESKMKDLIPTVYSTYNTYSNNEGLNWTGTIEGNCEIVDVKLEPKEEPIDIANFKCHNCDKYDQAVCFVCKQIIGRNGVEYRQRCQTAHCNRYYHLECLDHWPQTQFNAGELNKIKGDERFDEFMCPRHVCHTCVSDDPRGCKTRFSGDKLARCVKCPATYHSFTKCLPAGSQILTGSHIICPRHCENRPGKAPHHVNTGWCFICALGGSLICCEYCPTSFHAECLNIKPPEGGYMCEDCETGRLPLYGEMVWVKLGHYRWWPGIILHPSEIPENILAVKHSPGEFVVRFFGQYDHNWVNRGRVFPFQEGDSGKISSQKSKIDEAFTMAMEHAQRACKILKSAETKDQEDVDIVSSLLPPHYVKLKVNRPVGSLCGRKVDIEESSLTQCECDPNEEEPCGPYSQCLNRMLLTECGPGCRAGDRCSNRNFEKRLYPKMGPYRASHRGWGLRALEDIKAGQFVIEYVGELIDEEEFRRRMNRKHEIRDENFYFLTLDKERMIDAGPKGNLARFMNHCCEPNCETQKWTVLGDVRVGLFAINDIPAKSELTFNYNLECAGIEKKRCLCGAKRCSGYIGAKPKQEIVQPKKTSKNKNPHCPTKRTYKKRKQEEAKPLKPKRPIGRPCKPRELTEIEKDLLIIKNATNGISSDSECSGRLSSVETDKQTKSLKRKIHCESDINGHVFSAKKAKLEEVGD